MENILTLSSADEARAVKPSILALHSWTARQAALTLSSCTARGESISDDVKHTTFGIYRHIGIT